MPKLDELIRGQEIRYETLKEFIGESDGRINIDWQAMADYENKRKRDEPKIVMGRIYGILGKIGILSKERNGNYLITHGGTVVINPHDNLGVMYYFTRLEDAKAFRESFYKYAEYTLNVGGGVPIFQGIED